MSDYSKLNIRATNFGLNIAHDASTLDFGKYIRLTNVNSKFEGQLTSRAGLTVLDTGAPVGDPVFLVRRLNDTIQNMSGYIVRIGTNLYGTVDGGGFATTVAPFNYTLLATGFDGTAINVGSIYMDNTVRPTQAWAYVADHLKMVKVAINPAGGYTVKNVGITRPPGPISSLIAGGAGNLTPGDTYCYRYTYYDNNTGVESLFNEDETVQCITLGGADTSVTISFPADAGVDPAVTHIRVYRKSTALPSWRRVDDDQTVYTGAPASVTDVASDISIASATLLDEVSDRPFSAVSPVDGKTYPGVEVPYLFGPVFGYMLACGEPNNPGIVYWSKKFNPDAHDPADFVQVTTPQDELLGGLIYDGKPYVFSREGLFSLVVGLGDNTFTPFKTPCGRGLILPHGFCVGPEIYFLGKDGVYATSGGQERLLTGDELRPIFQGQSTQGLAPIDYTSSDAFCRMVYFERELYIFYRGQDSIIYCLIYDLAYKRWRAAFFSEMLTTAYVDEETISQLLAGNSTGRLFVNTGTSDNGQPITSVIHTQFITLGAPLIHKEFGALITDIDPNGGNGVVVSVYTNKGASLAATATYTDATRVRKFLSLGNTYSEDIQIRVEWNETVKTPILYGYELLYRPETVQLERWSIQGVTHGMQGWQMMRSGYLALRSDGTVILTIVADGTSFSYTIASTGGNRRKIFVPLDPIKGKVFDYTITLGTATSFRLYNSQCEIHVKPWITSFGYAVVNPFVGDGGGDAGNIVASNTNPQDTGIPGGSGSGMPIIGGGSKESSQFTYLAGGGMPLTAPQAPETGGELGPVPAVTNQFE